MNKLFLIGNLTRDPETRTTPSGANVCSFTLAVDRRFPVNGEKHTDFFRVNAWGKLAEICEKYLSKGKKAAVVGELQAREYTGRDGATKISLDVNADEVEFLTPKSAAPEGHVPEHLQDLEQISDDELPF